MRPVSDARTDPSPPALHAGDAGVPAARKRPPRRSRRRTFGIAVLALLSAVTAVIAYNWQTIRGEALDRVEAARNAVIERPEFAVTDMEVEGHIQLSVHDIGRTLGLKPGTRSISSLSFDARKARAALLAHPWIEDAEVAIDPSGMMKVFVVERIPVAIWRNDDGFFLIDRKGAVIVPVPGSDARLDLPLLIGEGADEAVADARALIRGAPVTMVSRIAALVRRGGRRWDLITDDGLVVKLPATEPLDALRLLSERNLERKVAPFAVTGIDLRLSDEPPVLRLEPGAKGIRDELLRTLRTTYQ